MTNQQMHIYKYVQQYIVICQHHVSVTPVTIVMVLYHKNTISTQITVKLNCEL